MCDRIDANDFSQTNTITVFATQMQTFMPSQLTICFNVTHTQTQQHLPHQSTRRRDTTSTHKNSPQTWSKTTNTALKHLRSKKKQKYIDNNQTLKLCLFHALQIKMSQPNANKVKRKMEAD